MCPVIWHRTNPSDFPFWHWYRFDATDDFEIGSRDRGSVLIYREGPPNEWTAANLDFIQDFDLSSPVWTKAVINALTNYQGQRVKVGFALINGSNQFSRTSDGWYIDEVLVEVVPQ